MYTISATDARKQLFELLDRVENEETAAITRNGRIVVLMQPASADRGSKRSLGAYKGKVTLSEDFDEPLAEFAEYVE